jgi:DNA-binding response OmpR family regulator
MSTQRDPDFLQRLAQRIFTPTRLHILIVEPDTSVAHQLAGALRRDHAVTVVGTAAAALAAISAHLPTLVATEFDLPDAFGLDLLTALHSRPATQSVLLLVLSRRTSIQDRIAAFQAGADDFMIKPIAPQTFAAHVQRLSRFRQVLTSNGS